MSVLNYLELNPEAHDPMRVTLRKILARLNSPLQWAQETDVDVNVTNSNTSNTDAYATVNLSIHI